MHFRFDNRIQYKKKIIFSKWIFWNEIGLSLFSRNNINSCILNVIFDPSLQDHWKNTFEICKMKKKYYLYSHEMKSHISDDQKEYEKITKSFEYELLSWSIQEDQSSFSIYKKASDSRVDVKEHLVLSWTDHIIEIRKSHIYTR